MARIPLTVSLSLLVATLTPASTFAATPSTPRKMVIDCEILAPDGKPAPGAQVWLARTASYHTGDRFKDTLLASGVSDTEGRLHVTVEWPDDSENRYGAVIARLEGKGLTGGSMFSMHAIGPSIPQARALVKLVPTAGCRMKFITPDGTPAAGVKVWPESCAMPKEQNSGSFHQYYFYMPHLPELGWEATTDAEGRCVIPRLPQDAVVYVQHDAPGLAQLSDKHITYSKILPRATNAESSHQLAPAGTLRGRLKLPDGSPAQGGAVYLIDTIPYTTAYSADLPIKPDGTFEFAQIPASKYKLSYRALLQDQDRWIGDEKKDIPIKSGATTDLGDLALTVPAIVTAQILDSETGEEIESPLIFRLKAGTHALNYRTRRVSPQTHIPLSQRDAITVEVAAGEHKAIAYRLKRRKAGESVTVTVLNTKGEPAPRTFVALMGGQGDEPFVFPRPADEKGMVRFEVNDARARLSVIAWDASSISEPTEAALGASVTVKLQDTGLGGIRGVIRDEQGHPIEGARFSFVHNLYALSYMMQGPFPSELMVQKDGRFEVLRLPKAIQDVTLFASCEGRSSAALRGQPLQPGQVFEWNPVLKPVNEVVAGIVVDQSGTPVPGVQVRISGDDQPSGTKPVKTDASGRFRFEKQAKGQAYAEASLKTEAASRRVSTHFKAPKEDLKLTLPDPVDRVKGLVVDHRGQPAPKAEVQSLANDRKTVTDAQGRFELTGLVKGWFTATIRFRNAEGLSIDHRLRVKTGADNVRLQMPEKTEEYATLVAPLDLIGKTAPEIHVETWINSPALETKAGGKVRILDFWGMECGPCLAGFPKVQKFWAEHQKDGIEFIALGSGFYPEQEVREFLKLHHDYTFPIALQPIAADDGQAYDVRGIPAYIVIGKDGLILSKGHDWEEAAAIALKAVAKGSE